ncbi:hypothetical protein DXG03_007126 [Asterophora parasitica]|uniref:Acetyltransferase component of pyruvate dehydrogenase complex n=1 Tax=Asterophora parasitica TaxID=117018 RepID=A0A9P7KHU3_9AGAR|nr:hypothetical protein DXG03_007126 [Asterophora parasitica]
MSVPAASRIFARRFHVSARRGALSRFNMPAMSPTMSEGGIASWKKKEGETFTTGDVLLEIETDKATIDVEAQDDGILAKIIAPDGAKNVQVGAAIAIIGEEGDDISGAAKMASDATAEPSPAEKSPEPTKPVAPSPPKSESSQSEPKAETKSELPAGDRIFASPIAKKIALERGIPLAQVKGSGPNGRIIRTDVESYKPAPAATTSTTTAASQQPPSTQLPDYVDTPVSNMRRTIGARLTQSKQELPHYYLTVEVNMDKVLKLREVFNKTITEKDKSAKLSVNDFIVKAVACALNDVPEANSAWLGEVIRTYKKADISIAVATPTGLITPIVKDAGSKGLATISAETKALAAKARDGKLQPQEYQGGTFTISNLGMFGIDHFTAIINPPQSCILAVGSTQPTLIPAPEEERGFKTVNTLKVTLSSDHRTVDGAVGARWLSAFKGYLENPLTFMLHLRMEGLQGASPSTDEVFGASVMKRWSDACESNVSLKGDLKNCQSESEQHQEQARALQVREESLLRDRNRWQEECKEYHDRLHSLAREREALILLQSQLPPPSARTPAPNEPTLNKLRVAEECLEKGSTRTLREGMASLQQINEPLEESNHGLMKDHILADVELTASWSECTLLTEKLQEFRRQSHKSRLELQEQIRESTQDIKRVQQLESQTDEMNDKMASQANEIQTLRVGETVDKEQIIALKDELAVTHEKLTKANDKNTKTRHLWSISKD